MEDILDVSRMITGKLRLDVQSVMPATVVESAIVSVRLMAEANGIQLQSAVDTEAGPVSGDPTRLQQVVWNLLSNAIKFTPKGGRVQVEVRRVNSRVEIAVADTGQGIDPAFLPHVFDRFRQADSATTRRQTGLGLGLAIVRHLVELHGGRVSATSRGLGKGATFTVELPVMAGRTLERDLESSEAAALASQATAKELPKPDLAGAKVLIIDDDEDARKLVAAIVEHAGARVLLAASADEGFARATQWRPSLIISDIGMPVKDGLAFIQDFRTWEKQAGGQTPAIALTAYARSEDRVRALAVGFQAHLAKPIDPAELLFVIARQLERDLSRNG